MKNLVFIGMIGSGMKSVAQSAAESLERKFVDTDEVITRNIGASLHDLYTLFPLDSFRDITYRLALQLSQSEDYVIALGDSILKNPDAMEELKNTAYVVYIEQDVDSIVANCTDTAHPLLARGLHRVAELYNERKQLFADYADIVIPYTDNSAGSALRAYTMHVNKPVIQNTDPALHAFFRYLIESKNPNADSLTFADECTAAVNEILKRYIMEEK